MKVKELLNIVKNRNMCSNYILEFENRQKEREQLFEKNWRKQKANEEFLNRTYI